MTKNNSASNVIPFVHPAIVDALADFESSKTLDAFLALMTKAVQIPSTGPLVFESWHKHRADVGLKDSWGRVSEWLSRLDLRRGEIDREAKSNSSPLPPPVSSPGSGYARSLINEAEAKNLLRESKMQDAGFAYNMFLGAWPFDKELGKFPSIERSAQVINRFVQLFFSGSTEPEPTKILVRIDVPPFIHFVVTDMLDAVLKEEHARIPESARSRHEALRLVELLFPSILLLLAGSFRLTEPNSYPTGFSLQRVVLVLKHLPQAFKARLLVQIANDLYDETEGGSDYPPMVEPLRHLLGPMLNSPDTPADAFEPLVGALRFSEASAVLGMDFVKDILAQFSDRLRKQRRDGGGVSLLTCEQADGLCQEIGSLAFRHDDGLLSTDLAILMAPSTFTYQSNWNTFNYYELPPEDYCDADEGGQMRSEWYLRICRVAREEGYWELANACLAFFLFSQPQLCQGRLLSDWRALAELIKSGVGMPGDNAVRDAAGIALEVIRKHGLGEGLDALNLEGWRSDATISPANLEQLLRAVPALRSAEADLQKAIGSENWLRLSNGAKHALLTAEKSWTAMAAEVGYGTSDFGQIAVGYIKAIELELTNRCRFLLTSSSYDTYCRGKFGRGADSHLTLGSVIGVLRDYPKLPEALQNEIDETGMKLHHDAGLIKRLLAIKNLRNDGAHSTEVGGEKFIQLRTDLFKNGFLKRFVEGLGGTVRFSRTD